MSEKNGNDGSKLEKLEKEHLALRKKFEEKNKEIERLTRESANKDVLVAQLTEEKAKLAQSKVNIIAECEEKLKGSRKIALVLKEALKKMEQSDSVMPISLAKTLVRLDNDIARMSVLEEV